MTARIANRAMLVETAIGDLTRLVTIQDPHPTDTNGNPIELQDAVGQPIKGWHDVAKVHAHIRPMSGREIFRAQEKFAEARTAIAMRYLPGLTAQMRIVDDEEGTIYHIVDVQDLDGRRIEHVAFCTSGVIDG